MLVRIARTWRVVGRTWGHWVLPVVSLSLFSALRTATSVGLALDPWLFPGLRRQRVTRPIVIVGNPRTGTTFLQRFLASNGWGSGQPLWRMLYPSLALQRVLGPFIPVLEKISPARHHSTAAHETSLTSVETDDVSLLFRHFDGFFLYGFFHAFDDVDRREYFDPALRDFNARDFAWFSELWRRGQLVDGADRVVAKLFSLGARTPAFLQHFPDARVLFMVRDPVAVLPSGMSLVTGVLDLRFGFWKLPEAVRARYLERLYLALVELMRRFHDDWQSGRIARESVLVVRYDRMMRDFEGVMDEICAFVDHEMTAEQRAAVERTAREQRGYHSEHRYDLARFGLTEERIRRDCDFYYRAFLSDGTGETPSSVA